MHREIFTLSIPNVIFLFSYKRIHSIYLLYSLYSYQRYFWGRVPQNFGRVCCSMGPPKTMFYYIFKKEFWGCVVLWDQIFLENSPKNSKNFRIFSQKINVLRFKKEFPQGRGGGTGGSIARFPTESTHAHPWLEPYLHFRRSLHIVKFDMIK